MLVACSPLAGGGCYGDGTTGSPAQSLMNAMPRPVDHHALRDLPAYPFATLWSTPMHCIPALLDCLPPLDELLRYLDAFERHVAAWTFPHLPSSMARSEVERFLANAPQHAAMFPDMLALLLTTLALGAQYAGLDKSGGLLVPGAGELEPKRSDVYSENCHLNCTTRRGR